MKHLQCKNATNNDVRENWGNFNPYKQQMINGTQAVVLAYLKMLMDNVNIKSNNLILIQIKFKISKILSKTTHYTLKLVK